MTSGPDNVADPIKQFHAERTAAITRMAADPEIATIASRFVIESCPYKYTYHFDWLGRPIIQFPQDIVAFQEIVWRTRPELIVETGIAHGGSLILSASLLALLDICDAAAAGSVLNPHASKRQVIGIDIDIRQHNRELIEAHPLASRIRMIQGSSIDPEVIAKVSAIAEGHRRVMVCLDSNHTHAHVLGELKSYAPLVTKDCYCIVWDTVIEDMPQPSFPDRPWGHGDNPKTAVHEYLQSHPEFVIENSISDKLLITVAPDGYLRKIA